MDKAGPNRGARPGPLYKQVKAAIVDALEKGEWRVDDQIPTESALASRFSVGISTIRAAISELATAGVLDRVQGKGTFVAMPTRHSSHHRFFRVMPLAGRAAEPVSEVLSFRRLDADGAMREALGLGANGRQRVYLVNSITRFDAVPVVISEFAIPEAMFKGLDRRTFVEPGLTPFGVYQKLYGISIVRTSERIFAASMSSDDLLLFSVDVPQPILVVHRIAYFR